MNGQKNSQNVCQIWQSFRRGRKMWCHGKYGILVDFLTGATLCDLFFKSSPPPLPSHAVDFTPYQVLKPDSVLNFKILSTKRAMQLGHPPRPPPTGIFPLYWQPLWRKTFTHSSLISTVLVPSQHKVTQQFRYPPVLFPIHCSLPVWQVKTLS